MQVQISELEAKLGAKEYEISSGKVRQQELLRDTESNRQLLQSALDRHNQSFVNRSAILSQQVDAQARFLPFSSQQSRLHPTIHSLKLLSYFADAAAGLGRCEFT
jgi:hypothetical protein